MKRIFCGLLCAAALLLTACGQKTAAQAEAAADPAVAAAQRYQAIVQAVGDGTRAGVNLTDAQIAQAVAQLSDAGLTAVHVDAADPVTHPETVTACSPPSACTRRRNCVMAAGSAPSTPM